MPPQSYEQSNDPIPAKCEQRPAEENSRQQRVDQSVPCVSSRASNGVVGDYTLSKTLGVGSMGKVRLAKHGNSGERVCLLFGFLVTANVILIDHASSLSRSCLASFLILIPVPRLQQGRPPMMLLKRFAYCARLPYPCFFTTPTSAACGR